MSSELVAACNDISLKLFTNSVFVMMSHLLLRRGLLCLPACRGFTSTRVYGMSLSSASVSPRDSCSEQSMCCRSSGGQRRASEGDRDRVLGKRVGKLEKHCHNNYYGNGESFSYTKARFPVLEIAFQGTKRYKIGTLSTQTQTLFEEVCTASMSFCRPTFSKWRFNRVRQ